MERGRRAEAMARTGHHGPAGFAALNHLQLDVARLTSRPANEQVTEIGREATSGTGVLAPPASVIVDDFDRVEAWPRLLKDFATLPSYFPHPKFRSPSDCPPFAFASRLPAKPSSHSSPLHLSRAATLHHTSLRTSLSLSLTSAVCQVGRVLMQR